VALGRSRLGIVRPDNFAEGDGERWRLRSSVSHTNCFAPPLWPATPNGLTGTVAANDPSPLRLSLERENQSRRDLDENSAALRTGLLSGSSGTDLITTA
jgi:hypothetical protein